VGSQVCRADWTGGALFRLGEGLSGGLEHEEMKGGELGGWKVGGA
jgi:hypothetical protein